MKLRALTAITSVLVSIAAPAALADTGDEIESILTDVIEQQRLVGTQAVVWHDGEIIYEGAFGLADAAQGVPVTHETRFFIASVTKTVTGLAAHQLVKEGRLDLDAPIQTYLPNFPTTDGPPITTRLLLAHRGGIRHYNRDETTSAGFFDTHYETATAALEKFRDDALIAPPGSREQYSSFGYTLIAAVIESVTGHPFDEHVRGAIFEPLEMANTEAPDWRYPVTNLAPSYGYYLPHIGPSSGEPFAARRLDFSYNAGGGNLVSTARDLIRYGVAHLPGNEIDAWHTSAVLASDGADGERFGWYIPDGERARRVMHATGASEAYQGAISVYPDDNLVVVALSNTWGVNSRAGGFTLTMHDAIADAVLGSAE